MPLKLHLMNPSHVRKNQNLPLPTWDEVILMVKKHGADEVIRVMNIGYAQTKKGYIA